MRELQLVPKRGYGLYGAMVAEEIKLSRSNRGTLHRVGRKQNGWAKWKHKSYPGWVWLMRGPGGVVCLQVKSKKPDAEWQLLSSLLGFVDRHFGDKIRAINIQYGD